MKAVIVIVAAGLISLFVQKVSAADPQINAATKPLDYRSDPFWNFVWCFRLFEGDLDRYDKLPPSLGASDRQHALNEVRGHAAVLADREPKFAIFFVESNLPPEALAVSKPVFDALKAQATHEKQDRLIPNFEQANIDQLKKLHALYAALPLPTDQQLSQYIDAAYPLGPSRGRY